MAKAKVQIKKEKVDSSVLALELTLADSGLVYGKLDGEEYIFTKPIRQIITEVTEMRLSIKQAQERLNILKENEDIIKLVRQLNGIPDYKDGLFMMDSAGEIQLVNKKGNLTKVTQKSANEEITDYNERLINANEAKIQKENKDMAKVEKKTSTESTGKTTEKKVTVTKEAPKEETKKVAPKEAPKATEKKPVDKARDVVAEKVEKADKATKKVVEETKKVDEPKKEKALKINPAVALKKFKDAMEANIPNITNYTDKNPESRCSAKISGSNVASLIDSHLVVMNLASPEQILGSKPRKTTMASMEIGDSKLGAALKVYATIVAKEFSDKKPAKKADKAEPKTTDKKATKEISKATEKKAPAKEETKKVAPKEAPKATEKKAIKKLVKK